MCHFDNSSHIRIYIIESLADSDLKTGSNLFNDLLKYLEYKDSLNDSELIKVKTKTDFLSAFNIIERNIKEESIFPIIHIEAHGNEKSIVLEKGEILWSDLYDELIKINVLLSNRLILVLAMCNGGWITSCFNPEKRAPFRYLLSSANVVYEKELQNALVEFYSTFFFSEYPTLCLENLNNEIKNGESKFLMFDIGERFDYLVNLQNDPNQLNLHVGSFKKIRESDPNFKSLSNELQNEEARKYIKTFYDNIRAKKDYFMMTDLKQ